MDTFNQEGQESLSTKEQLLILGKEAPISQIANVLGVANIRVSKYLKTTVGICNFQDRIENSTRIISLTNELVDKLLELPIESVLNKEKSIKQTTKESGDIEPGMQIKDFKILLKDQIVSAEEAWQYLISKHVYLFQIIKKGRGKRNYQVPDIYKEETLRIAREYIQEKTEEINKKRGHSHSIVAYPKKYVDFLTKIDSNDK
ncbi:MAG: hypothetical protein PHQ95_04505 [Candidatus Gracilibacteria bacterium]|nr:hypothetical protein [Candidatus Gracilibacteria bacterium]